MVKHTDIHELTAFDDTIGNLSVGLARFSTTRGVIMREDHGGCIHFYRFSHNFSRMNLNVAQCTRKQAAVFYYPIFIIEKDHHEDLAPGIGQLVFKNLA